MRKTILLTLILLGMLLGSLQSAYAADHVTIDIVYTIGETFLLCTTDLPDQPFDFVWYVNDHHVKTDGGVTQSTLSADMLEQGDAVRCEAWFPGVNIRYGFATLVWQEGTPLEGADLTVDPTSGEAPLTVAYACHGIGGDEPLSYTIDFGDGSSVSHDATGTHTFTNPGTYTVTCTVEDANGDTVSDSVDVTVYTPVDHTPTATLMVHPTSGIAPLTVNYTCSGSGGDAPLSYMIDFGDGTPAVSTPSGSHTFTTPGSYLVSCEVVDADNDIATDAVWVTVEEDLAASAGLTVTPTTGDAPLTVSYTCTGGGNAPLNYRIDFGDGSPVSSMQNGTHTYTTPGDYTVTCEVVDADGDVASASRTVHVQPADQPAAAHLTVTPTMGNAPLTVTYACNGSGNSPLVYTVDFGDGSPVSSAASGTHTYSMPGNYTVACTVVDADGDTAVDSVRVTVTPADQPASATLMLSPTSGTVPLTVNGSCAFTGDTPFAYVIDFDDGSIITGATYASEAFFTHTYTTPGDYTVTCRVTDVDGDTASDSMLVTAREADVPVHIADFTVTPMSGEAPLTVSYSCSATGNEPISYTITFGDGTPASMSPSGTHTFTTPGDYVVTCEAVDADGDTAVESVLVRVREADLPASADLMVTPTSGEVPLTVSYACSGSGNTPLSYTIDFGDGSPASPVPSGTHTYSTPGDYTVTCTVEDADGDTAVDTARVTVREPDTVPVVYGLMIDPQVGLAPLTVTYQCAAGGGNAPLSYTIDFGDGTPAAGTPSGTHVYTTPGEYTLSCLVTDADGDTALVSGVVRVLIPASASLIVTPTAGEAPLTVTAWLNVSDPGQVEAVQWDFADGITADGRLTRVHTYPRPGVYTLRARLEWVNGTVQRFEQPVVVREAAARHVVDWEKLRMKHAFAWRDARGVHVTVSVENLAGEDARVRLELVSLPSGVRFERVKLIGDGMVGSWQVTLPVQAEFVKIRLFLPSGSVTRILPVH